mgnify:CR=1 FL=1|tara:strand:- start:169 stop:2151 length:1983 start_codon:yes stop_codon:yes gene_type:complete
MYQKLFFLLLVSFFVHSNSINNFGAVGYINSPSAFNSEQAKITLNTNFSSDERRYIVHASPFDWLDVNLFYIDLRRISYGGGFDQSYKDKGFNLKFSYQINDKSALALGLNDFAGTGLLSSEYLVYSIRNKSNEFTAGIGWGVMSGALKVENPLKILDDRFNARSGFTKDLGGSVDFANFFSGDESSIFLAYKKLFKNNLNVIVEVDPFAKSNSTKNYWDEIFGEIAKDRSLFNFGIEKKFNNYDIKINLIDKNSINLNFSYTFDYNYERVSPYKGNVKSDIRTIKELKAELEKNAIALKRIDENNDSISLNVRQTYYQDVERSKNKVMEILLNSEMAKEKENIKITQEVLNMEVIENVIKFKNGNPLQENNDQAELTNVFMVNNENLFPIINNTFGLNLRPFLASREAGLFNYGLIANNNTNIVLKENLIINMNLKHSIYDTFNELVVPPRDTYPNQVRSDVKEYLRGMGNGIVIGRLEFNLYESLNKKHFFRLSGGIFEEMFSGLGFDYLYYPQESNLALGFEAFSVVKRDYKMRFGNLNYDNEMVRAKLIYFDDYLDVTYSLSFGEYLAGDEGYTFQAMKRFKNGVEFGGFFTITDVPKELFGEGSFDKGLKFIIPFALQPKASSPLANFVYRPLTKDPGALLIKSNDLYQEIRRLR